MVQYNDIFFLIEVVGFAQACILALTYASMLYLRYKHPEIPRPIKVSWIQAYQNMKKELFPQTEIVFTTFVSGFKEKPKSGK